MGAARRLNFKCHAEGWPLPNPRVGMEKPAGPRGTKKTKRRSVKKKRKPPAKKRSSRKRHKRIRKQNTKQNTRSEIKMRNSCFRCCYTKKMFFQTVKKPALVQALQSADWNPSSCDLCAATRGFF